MSKWKTLLPALLAVFLGAAACAPEVPRRRDINTTPQELWDRYSSGKEGSDFCLLVTLVCESKRYASNPICKTLLARCSSDVLPGGSDAPAAADSGGGGGGSSPDAGPAPDPDSSTGGSGGGGGGSGGGSDGGSGSGSDGGSGSGGGGAGGGPTLPMCVWNQAYEEHGNNDSVSAILAGAKGCYVLIDPFDSSAARSGIATMKQNGNIVGCYISVGSCEDWRDDYAAMKKYCGPAYPGWEGEYFVTDTQGILPLMKARIDKMATWGCDMVEFDNMDWAYDGGNKTGVSTADAHAYVQALCSYTHSKGMKCMAKSTTEGASDFDGLTVESYTDDKNWWSSSEMKDILNTGKLGVIVHYNDSSCDKVYSDYQNSYGYGSKLSFVCSDKDAYLHYNAP
jgi:hypothetical protein